MLKKLWTAALALLLCLPSGALADIIINEVMASNGMYENEKSYDWVELYNNGSKSVDLSG